VQRVRGPLGDDNATRHAPKSALWAVALVVALIATTFVIAPGAAAQRVPTCFGVPATIVATPGEVTVGTPGPDVIVGTPGRDVILAGGGDDLVCSGAGNDRVDGGAGDDRIDLGPGDDLAFGRSGDDRLLGGAGRDRLLGGSGADRLDGGDGPDLLRGGPGDDRLDGGSGADRLFGGSGKDVLDGGSGPDRLVGGPGVDRLDGGPGHDRLVGGAGDDDCGASPRDIRTRCAARAPTPAPVAEVPASELEPGLAALRATVEDDVLAVYGATNPWLVEAWNWIDTEGDVVVEDPGPFVAGRVRTLCGGNAGLPLCRATTMTIHPDFVGDIDVIIHELAHVWERTHALAPDRGATARAQLYMLDNHRHQCHPAEVVADTMLHLVRPEAYLAYFDFACPTLPDAPTAEMEAVVAAMLDGVDHPWFASVYGNGTVAWASLMAMTEDPFGFERHVLVHNLADEFGGYCSVGNTIDTAFRGGADPNPWADDGC
jgi:hypothetical protein